MDRLRLLSRKDFRNIKSNLWVDDVETFCMFPFVVKLKSAPTIHPLGNETVLFNVNEHKGLSSSNSFPK